MKICVLPLDSRPCTYDFARDLAGISGLDIVMPPIDIMGNLLEPSDFSTISQWLLANAINCNALVISIEQLLYGGLVASRQSRITLAAAQEKLKILNGLKAANPKLRIFAFNVLMRTTISTLSLESVVWWEAVGEYSKYAHLAQMEEENLENKRVLRELEEKIPDTVLNEFLSVRERNHEINKACIGLVNQGIIDFLPIPQEDCDEFGMHKAEQERLTELIDRYGLQQKVLLHNGTDEAVTELLARAVSGSSVPICVKWLGYNQDFTALFEDRPFADNLESHLRTVNMHEDEAADTVLFIYTPKSSQGDFCAISKETPVSGYSASETDYFAKEIADAAAQGKKCYILDVAFANGGDIELLRSLAKYMDISDIYGYSAWNTACNALGTILSQIVLSDSQNTEKNKSFTYSRILDDAIYQSIIRQRLNNVLVEKGLDPWRITDLGLADKLLQHEFKMAKPIIDEIITDCSFGFSAHLRWPRTFEIEILMKELG